MPRRSMVESLVASREEHQKEAPKHLTIEPLFSKVSPKECLPTGITIMNLAMSGRVDGGVKLGTLVHIVGDSETGKSLAAYTMLAEASICTRFRHYDLIKDDVEQSDAFPVEEMFGKDLAKRLQEPHKKDGVPAPSEMIEEFYAGVYKRLKMSTPFVYTLDSMDALEAIDNTEKYEANVELMDKGKKMLGSYGDGKAKINSTNLRKIKAMLKRHQSILIIVSQTRDNINPMTMDPKTHAGGKALKFYSQYQMWLANAGRLTRTINGNKVHCGNLVKFKLSKNQVTGKHLDFEIPFYYGYGIDDEQSIARWMTNKKDGCGLWTIKDGSLTTQGEPGLQKKYSIKEFIRLGRGEHRVALLQAVQKAWDDLEMKIRLPGRYSGKAFIQEDSAEEE